MQRFVYFNWALAGVGWGCLSLTTSSCISLASLVRFVTTPSLFMGITIFWTWLNFRQHHYFHHYEAAFFTTPIQHIITSEIDIINSWWSYYRWYHVCFLTEKWKQGWCKRSWETEYIHQCRSYVTSQSLAQEGRCQVAKCWVIFNLYCFALNMQ